MKWIHCADLHLGKKVNEYSMMDNQRDFLNQLLEVLDKEKADALLLSGDIYDKSVPSSEAVECFDAFLSALLKKKINVFAISGNHDSCERLAFGNRIFACSDIFFSPVYDGHTLKVTKEDAFGPIHFYLLPFVRPSEIRAFFPDETIESYNDALRVCVREMHIDKRERNVLLAHQFLTHSQTSGEESVGSLDGADAHILEDFDYVALGHIHKPQCVLRDVIRYSGSPLKYSYSEINHHKSLVCVEIKEKGSISIELKDITPLYDLRELRGSFDELIHPDFIARQRKDDYLKVVLTDEEERLNAMNILSRHYPHIMSLEYDNSSTRYAREEEFSVDEEEKDPYDLFTEFYENQNGKELSEDQRNVLKDCIKQAGEDLPCDH